ncbi:MAG: tripartite tricarboxylate transporter substrate binding protein [Betaproteobacteria bacterium]|jgi:tripartite-type tricarboxylate transporter receptor subunit TctC|nr:tripartite tricarboxylate transporter substrate binding protein [Betaproteobacteria bacterium]
MPSGRPVAAVVRPVLLSLLMAFGAMLPAAHAQLQFPVKPIRLIVGSAAGSGPDIIGRAMADRLGETWGQRIIVDPRPGAAGAISADLAMAAVPDGYTMMMLTSQLFVASQVLNGLKFDLGRDFQSIALIGTVPFVLLANTQVPAKTLRELVELARKAPGTLRYGSAGTGASEHLSGVLLTQLTKTDMLHVPYKGVPQAIADAMANEVQVTYAVVPAAMPHVQSGRLRALGVTTPARAPLLPDVPSISEVVPGYAMYGWYSIVAPTGTPTAVLNQASAEMVRVMKEPAFGERLRALGVDLVAGDRQVLDKWRSEELQRIRAVVKMAGARQ